jgi:hypothetical protein
MVFSANFLRSENGRDTAIQLASFASAVGSERGRGRHVRDVLGGFKLAEHGDSQAADPAQQTRVLDPYLGRARLRPAAIEKAVQFAGQSGRYRFESLRARYRTTRSQARSSAPSKTQGQTPSRQPLAVPRVLAFHRDNCMYEWTAANRLPIGQDSRRQKATTG